MKNCLSEMGVCRKINGLTCPYKNSKKVSFYRSLKSSKN